MISTIIHNNIDPPKATMDPPTATMGLPTGWGKATYKDKTSGVVSGIKYSPIVINSKIKLFSYD